MEEVVYLSVRLICVIYLLYKLWGIKQRINEICSLLYGTTSFNERKAKETIVSSVDVMGSTNFVYLDENAGKTVAPYMSMPLESDDMYEEEAISEDEVDCSLPLEDMALFREVQKEMDEKYPKVDNISPIVTLSDLDNMGDVLFNIGDSRYDDEKSMRAACTLYAIKETDMFAAISSQVENKDIISELIDRFLDEDGNPKSIFRKQKKNDDWRKYL